MDEYVPSDSSPFYVMHFSIIRNKIPENHMEISHRVRGVLRNRTNA